MNNVIGEIYKIRDTMVSHDHMAIIQVMGNTSGNIALYAGIGGAADHILLPEVPFDRDELCDALNASVIRGKLTRIIVLAEGAGSGQELATYIHEKTGIEIRTIVLGYIQRGGSPCAYDRVLATEFGVHAAELIRDEVYGVTVALSGNNIIHNKLGDIAGVAKPVPKDSIMVQTARNIGITFGD
ncbi:ATP-dependent 6-phosphofructokinase [bioreactor metagenome]|uniref:6-phosphofructokinase n=1 Tax=bioreactor metagenome TaxID=1076179 RepID=A0A645IJT6_9ZZZZ